MYARSTTIQAKSTDIDPGIAHIRDVVMPALQQINGCVGVSLMVDRQIGQMYRYQCLGNRRGDARKR
ncbi:hypothetical protein MSIMFI_05118 [Mycobacterium simulans]|nr:hypothetical protein MSIMFI_05118 [Mycobacterium simulans]